MAVKSSGKKAASGRELVIERTFDAPRELVWKAWTDPEMLKQWSAPHGVAIPVSEGELRPGGKWRACMHTPEGKDLWLGGTYREIVPPERLVFTHAWDDPSGKPGHETLITVILTERAGKTEMDFRQTGFDSNESRDGHNDGWNQCFERLKRLVA
ncbi:MAG TPA: SRPBCC domain-containing protein [Gemmatimonadaceae bacterium]|nr:SRPBCC domain-containing protein [Gemmatimonadaceae bacterium]